MQLFIFSPLITHWILSTMIPNSNFLPREAIPKIYLFNTVEIIDHWKVNPDKPKKKSQMANN